MGGRCAISSARAQQEVHTTRGVSVSAKTRFVSSPVFLSAVFSSSRKFKFSFAIRLEFISSMCIVCSELGNPQLCLSTVNPTTLQDFFTFTVDLVGFFRTTIEIYDIQI